MPDLVVIDGGKGQLGVALAALRDVGIDIGKEGPDVVGLAKESEDVQGEKRPDRVFLPNVKDPIKLRPNSSELFLLARLRDEAHRFANSLHRKLFRRTTLRSVLEDVPGIGAVRRKQLLTHFGSLKKIKEATVEDLAAAPTMSLPAARKVFQFFHPPEDESVDENAEGGLHLLAEEALDLEAEKKEEPPESSSSGDGG